MYEASNNMIFELSRLLRFFFGLYSWLIVVMLLNKSSILKYSKGVEESSNKQKTDLVPTFIIKELPVTDEDYSFYFTHIDRVHPRRY